MSYEKRRARSISSKSYSAIDVTEFLLDQSDLSSPHFCSKHVQRKACDVCRVVFAGKAREPIMKMAAETNGIIEP